MFMSPKNKCVVRRRTLIANLLSKPYYLVLYFFLGACAVGPDFKRPPAPRIQSYNYGEDPSGTITANALAQHFTYNGRVTPGWWRLFNCPVLDTVVAQSIANNPTYLAALANLRQSEDNLRADYGIFYPQLGASFQPSRQEFSPARFGENTAPSTFNLYTLSTSVSYVLDIFGGERRMIEALGAERDVQYYNAEGAYMTLAGNVVNSIVAVAAYQAEIESTARIIRYLREQETITLSQVKAGTVPYSNLLSVQSQLALAEATLPSLRQQLAHTQHLLATLVGEPTGDWPTLNVALSDLTLPKDLPVSLPSDLVRQRPDIMMAEAQLQTASAQIGVATAAMFPSFTLTGDYGWNNTSLPALFGTGAAFWMMGASLATPLVQGPTLWYQRKAAIDAYQQALANYRQAVLAGFAQVADALDALQHDAQALAAQSSAVESSAEALRLTQINYQAGTVNYLQVLTADNQYLQARLGYIQTVGQRMQDTGALFVAVGGGLSNMTTALQEE